MSEAWVTHLFGFAWKFDTSEGFWYYKEMKKYLNQKILVNYLFYIFPRDESVLYDYEILCLTPEART